MNNDSRKKIVPTADQIAGCGFAGVRMKGVDYLKRC